MNSSPVFTVSRSEDPDDEFAPFQVLKYGQPIMDRLEFEFEAKSIADLLNTPLKVIPINTHQRWLAGGVGGRHRETQI
ncbi:MAG: hypothetical protein WA192_12645 [Candidatus Acidiferrales bacterium]